MKIVKINEEDWHKRAIEHAFGERHRAIADFRRSGAIELSATFPSKSSILFDVKIEYFDAEGFYYFQGDVIAGARLNIWHDNQIIVPVLKPPLLHSAFDINIGPGVPFCFEFDGEFKDGVLHLPQVGDFPQVGNDFEVDYNFLTVRSNRVRIVVPE